MNNAENRYSEAARIDVLPVTSSRSPAELCSSRWFAVNTLPRSEARARSNIERQGWRCFSPQLLKTGRSKGRLTTQLQPLFPSYIFVELDPRQCNWRSVDGTYGVKSLVRQAGLPAALPQDYIETLISMTNDNGVFSFAQQLAPGDSVRFLSGPLTGLVGSLEQIDAHGRITILLSLLGQHSRVKSSVDKIAPAIAP